MKSDRQQNWQFILHNQSLLFQWSLFLPL